MHRVLVTVVETRQFMSAANRLIGESARLELIATVASNPEAGTIMPETGGVRKMRWAAKGKGKRGEEADSDLNRAVRE